MTEGYERVVDLLEREILLKTMAAEATSKAPLTLPEGRSRG